MIASMDLDTLELLLAELVTMWPGSMDRGERDEWFASFRSVDAQQAGEAILNLRHDPGFAGRRPQPSDFLCAHALLDQPDEDKDPVDEHEASAAAFARMLTDLGRESSGINPIVRASEVGAD